MSTQITVLSPSALRRQGEALSRLDTASRPALRENLGYHGDERQVLLGKTISNDVAYPVGTANNNTFWVEFGKWKLNNENIIGQTELEFIPFSPVYKRRCRTLEGGWVEEGAYVGCTLQNGIWYISQLPQTYFGTSTTSITTSTGTATLKALQNDGVIADLGSVSVRTIGGTISTGKNLYIWRSRSKFMCVEVC